MKHLAFAAVVMLASTAAQAQNAYNFEIDGRKIRIAAARNCNALSCLSVSIPGVYQSGQKRRSAEPQDLNDDSAGNTPAPSARIKPAADPVPAENAVTAQPRPVLASPSTVATASASSALEVTAPAKPWVSPPAAPQQQANLSQDLANTPTPAPASQPVQPQPAAQAEPSVLGIWNTEGGKGQVRIEACGKNLCGYAVSGKQSGKKVLIDLKQASASKWGGQIYDPNSGSTYDSTVTLKASNTLRVQGCAFGGMFCGGQTWTRAS